MRKYTDEQYYKNEWNIDNDYVTGECVTNAGYIYKALSDIAGADSVSISNTLFWEYVGPVAQKGYYQYISLDDMLNNFMFSQTGEGTPLGSINRNLVAYQMQRAIQELNYDVLRTERSQLIELNPNTRQITVPHDLVNLIQVSWLDGEGTKHPMISAKTDGGQTPLQEDDYEFMYGDDGQLLEQNPSETTERFLSPSREGGLRFQGYFYGAGFNDFEYPYAGGYVKRYGLEPQDANRNGKYLWDRSSGIIAIDDSVSVVEGPFIIAIDYVSDGLFDDSKIQVNKLAEKAVYKMTEYELMTNKAGVQEYVLRRVRKEMKTTVRNSKLRFMNLNMNELAQALRQQSKWIKH